MIILLLISLIIAIFALALLLGVVMAYKDLYNDLKTKNYGVSKDTEHL